MFSLDLKNTLITMSQTQKMVSQKLAQKLLTSRVSPDKAMTLKKDNFFSKCEVVE